MDAITSSIKTIFDTLLLNREAILELQLEVKVLKQRVEELEANKINRLPES